MLEQKQESKPVKKEKPNMLAPADKEYGQRAQEAELKYARQCLSGEVITYKLSPEELKRYAKGAKTEKAPSMIYAEGMKREDRKKFNKERGQADDTKAIV
ncbi:hypothetical protein [Anaerosolibacter sp.]|uniref:hypothetical protein n=1 Tax=Anaerosolibacter sp. TaxID=1872527 RepID=UPI0039EE16A9